ncbi:MAG: hypothetical protein HRT71_16830 [Flavobacteriales bacterium]|nr:hypothetical protein [Flavobacteriales bacterium]
MSDEFYFLNSRNKYKETEKCILSVIPGDIVRGETKPNKNINIEDAISNLDTYSLWIEDKSRFLIVSNIGVTATVEARKAYSNPKRTNLIKAEAIVIKSNVLKMLAKAHAEFNS